MANPIYLNSNGALDPTITDLFASYDSASISSGSITMTTSAMQVDTQSSAATDDLDTIDATNAEAGTVLFLRSTNAARVVRLKHLTGNIYIGGGNDLLLSDPQQLVLTVYSGTYWVVIGGAGGAPKVTITEGGGEDRGCVIAERLVLYMVYVLDAAAAAIPSGVIGVAAALRAALNLVNPAITAADVAALATTIVDTYANEAAMDAAFSATVTANLRCGVYCVNTANDTAFTAAMRDDLVARIDALTGDAYDILAEIIRLMGTDGLTNALGLSTITTTSEDCAGGCAYDWDFTTSCTSFVDTTYNGFCETGVGFRTGTTTTWDGFTTGYRMLGEAALPDVDGITGIECSLSGGLANAYVDLYDASNTLLYRWTVTSGGSGSSTNTHTIAYYGTVNNVAKVVIARGVTAAGYSGPAYVTRVRLIGPGGC